MQASRIIPDLQASLLCEDIRQEITGNLIFVGVINVIAVPQFPVGLFRLFVYNRWTAGVGNFTETVRLVAPDQTTVLRKNDVKFALQDPNRAWANVTVFGQIELTGPGTYFVEVLVDDVMKIRAPLPVLLAQQPPGQTQPPQTQSK